MGRTAQRKAKKGEADIPTFLFGQVIALVSQNGQDVEALVRNANITLEELKDHETRLTFDQALTIFGNAIDITGDPAFGLTLGTQQRLDDWGLLGYALATCRTMLDGMILAQKYSGVATAIVVADFEEGEDDYAILLRTREPAGDLLPFAIEEAFSSALMVHRQRSTDDVWPIRVDLAYARPAYAAKYDEVFRCPVYFDQPANRLVVSKKHVTAPLSAHNPVTARLAEQLCEQELKSRQVSNDDDLASKVYQEILRHPGNFPTSDGVACQFGMSRSTLSRALKKLGTSYQALLDEARERLAVEYLQASRLSLEEIAWLVGFSDAGNFHRAFKKWTGQPPTAFRKI